MAIGVKTMYDMWKEIDNIFRDKYNIELSQEDKNKKLSEFDIDSLGFLETIVELEERTGKIVDEAQLFQCKTVRDLIEYNKVRNFEKV